MNRLIWTLAFLIGCAVTAVAISGRADAGRRGDAGRQPPKEEMAAGVRQEAGLPARGTELRRARSVDFGAWRVKPSAGFAVPESVGGWSRSRDLAGRCRAARGPTPLLARVKLQI